MKADEIILKPTGTVQIVNPFSLIERKLLNGIIWHAQKSGHLTSEEYGIPISEVFRITGMENSRNYEVLKEALKKLATSVIEWNALRTDRRTEWGFCTFLSGGRISEGRLYYSLNTYLVKQINNPILFAKIQLLVQSRFKRRYTLILYEFLIDALCRQRVDTLTIKAPVDDLIAVLGLQGTHFAEAGHFKFLNRDILKPSLREINERSDICTECKPQRQKRRVAALVFQIELKASASKLLNLQSKAVAEVQLEGISNEDKLVAVKVNTCGPERAFDSDNDLVDQLRAHGVIHRKAKALVDNYPSDQIKRNLHLALETRESGRIIRSFAAFLVRAIEDDYAVDYHAGLSNLSESDKKSDEPKQHKCQEKEWKAFLSKRLSSKFDAQDNAWKEMQLAKLISKAEQENNTAILTAYSKSGLDSTIVRRCLLAQVKSELLTDPEEQNLESYLVWQAENFLNLNDEETN